jgi:hypothetical protein
MSNGQITEFRIGSVLGRSLGVLGKNLVPFGAVSTLFLAPPFVLPLLMVPLIGDTDSGSVVVVGVLSYFLIWILTYFLLSAVLMHGTIGELRGSRSSIGRSIRWVLGMMVPILGITIVATLGVFAGTLLLVVPGLILLTRWWIAVPAAVVERTGVGASLRRSAELTSGYRWRVFGILIIVSVVQSALESLAELLLGGAEILGSLISYAITVAVTAFYAVVSAVCYHDLRVLKDGVDIDEIARVFD